MNAKAWISGLVGALLIGGGAAAHQAITLKGSITEISAVAVVIRFDDGSTQIVRLDRGLPIYQGDRLMERAALQVGQSVTLEGFGDTPTDVEIQSIHLAPGLAKQAG